MVGYYIGVRRGGGKAEVRVVYLRAVRHARLRDDWRSRRNGIDNPGAGDRGAFVSGAVDSHHGYGIRGILDDGSVGVGQRAAAHSRDDRAVQSPTVGYGIRLGVGVGRGSGEAEFKRRSLLVLRGSAGYGDIGGRGGIDYPAARRNRLAGVAVNIGGGDGERIRAVREAGAGNRWRRARDAAAAAVDGPGIVHRARVDRGERKPVFRRRSDAGGGRAGYLKRRRLREIERPARHGPIGLAAVGGIGDLRSQRVGIRAVLLADGAPRIPGLRGRDVDRRERDIERIIQRLPFAIADFAFHDGGGVWRLGGVGEKKRVVHLAERPVGLASRRRLRGGRPRHRHVESAACRRRLVAFDHLALGVPGDEIERVLGEQVYRRGGNRLGARIPVGERLPHLLAVLGEYGADAVRHHAHGIFRLGGIAVHARGIPVRRTHDHRVPGVPRPLRDFRCPGGRFREGDERERLRRQNCAVGVGRIYSYCILGVGDKAGIDGNLAGHALQRRRIEPLDRREGLVVAAAGNIDGKRRNRVCRIAVYAKADSVRSRDELAELA